MEIGFDPKTKLAAFDPLKEAETRLAKLPAGTYLETDTLLLLSIARDARQQTILAENGIQFSQDLAKQFDRP